MNASATSHSNNLAAESQVALILAGTGAAQAGAVVHRGRPAAAIINPTITPTSPIAVVVKKTYTNPSRIAITLRASSRVRQPAKLTRIMTPTSGNIQLFNTRQGGAPLLFNPTGTANESEHVISASDLNRGKVLFAESDSPCFNLDDYRLRLTLAPGPTSGPPVEVVVVAVELTLDISRPRTAPGAILTPLPQPPANPPANPNDKWFGGLQLNAQDPGNNQKRAELRVIVRPSSFPGDLVLRQVVVNRNNIGRLDTKAQVFEEEIPGPRQTPPIVEVAKSNPFEFNASTAGFPGRQLFVQGTAGSRTVRDTGFQLGIKNVDNDGDRVALTVAIAPVLTVDRNIVVVKKPHTNPARRIITVRASANFGRTGTLTRSAGGPPIRLLDVQQPAAGTETVVTGAGHTFTAAELNRGVQLFAESLAPSGAVDDYGLTLTLAGGATPIAAPATLTLTAVDLTLDVGITRVNPGALPPLLSANDKINTGRFVQVRNSSFSHERALILLRPPTPVIPLTVVLEAITAQVQAFGIEEPAAGQSAHPQRASFPSSMLTSSPPGLTLFVEATAVSAAARDTGFRYGIEGLEAEADRIAMTAVQFDLAENDLVPTPPLTAVRFGLWDNAYDGAGNVIANFIDNDRRRFHFRIINPAAVAPIQINWKTMAADGTTNDDAPASQLLTLPAVAAIPGRFVSPGVMLVSDDTDAAQTTPQARGAAEHRLRRAAIDGFVSAVFQPAPGQFHRIMLPVFDRAAPFTITSASNVGTGSQIVTPSALSGTTTTGARWSIKVGSRLNIDTGANQEEVRVTAVTATTFTANFANAHNGTAAPFQIAGTTDERRRLTIRVVRYNNPADATYLSSTDANIADQFAHANLRWRQVGLQVDRLATQDRTIPAAALNAAGRFPFVHPNGAEEQAVFGDLLPLTPDNTLTAVFIHIDPAAQINAYAAILQTLPTPLPAGGTAPMGNRFFVFVNSRLDANLETLAHELHHVLFNRFDGPAPQRFFTFNTTAPNGFGIPLPSVRVYRRVQLLHTADPNTDQNNDNTFNWHRRARTARFPVAGNFNPAATATTGNNFTGEF